MSREIKLPADPGQALEALCEASADGPVVVFKHSPICPVSTAALHRFRSWLAGVDPGAKLGVAHIDVIAERELARGLVAAVDVRHESPQALWFAKGELTWHGSHTGIDAAALDRELG